MVLLKNERTVIDKVPKDKIFDVLLIVIALIEAGVLAYIMSKVVHTNLDNIDGLAGVYRWDKLYGYKIWNKRVFCNATTLLMTCAYELYGFSLDASRFISAVAFFPCFFLSELMVLRLQVKRSTAIVGSFLLFFWMMPTYHTNIYHYSATFAVLFLFFMVEIKIWKKDLKIQIFAILVLVFTLVFYGCDWILFALSGIVPIALCAVIRNIKSGNCKLILKKLLILITMLVAFCAILRCFGITELLANVYGAGSYTEWPALEDFFSVGKLVFTDFINYIYVLPYKGAMISSEFVFFTARYFLLVLSVWVLGRNAFYLIINMDKIELFDGVLTISIVLNLLVAVSQRSVLFSYNSIGYWTDILRYAVSSCFIVPILGTKYVVVNIDRVIDNTVNSKLFVIICGGILFFSLSVMMLIVTSDDSHWGYKELADEVAEILGIDENNVFTEGVTISPFIGDWVALDTAGRIDATSVSNNQVYMPDIYNNYRFLNFAVADARYSYGYSVTESQDYLVRQDIDVNDKLTGKVEKRLGSIFFFDHDIRWIPKNFSGDELSSGLSWKITCGTTRLKAIGDGLNEDALKINVPESVNVSVSETEDGIAYLIDSDRDAEIGVAINSDGVEYINIVPVYAANKILTDCVIEHNKDILSDFVMFKGEYLLSVWGEKIDKISIDISYLDGVSINEETAGTGQRIYRMVIDCDKADINVVIHNESDDNVFIEGMAIEATGQSLVDVKSQYQDTELGWIDATY